MGKGDPRTPSIPSSIPEGWLPNVQLLGDSPVLRAMEPAEIEALAAEFVKFCRARKIEKVMWGPPFLKWLSRRADPNWWPIGHTGPRAPRAR